MIEKKLQVFIDGIVNYFNHTSDKSIAVGVPYLLSLDESIPGDYTGVISISGAYTGCCYFTAPTILLKHLVMSLGEKDTSEAMLLDAAGEVANTLSGNARKQLGRDFIISVPTVIRGAHQVIDVPEQQRIYAIPIQWHAYKALLGVCLVG
jgi:chemotaxis protein CheX